MTDHEQGVLSELFGKLWGGWHTDEKAALVADLFRFYELTMVRDAVNRWWRQNPDAFRPKLADILADVKAKGGSIETERRWKIWDERSYRILNEYRKINGQDEESVQDYARQNAIIIPSVAERNEVIRRMRIYDEQYLASHGRTYNEAVQAHREWLRNECESARAKREAAKDDPKMAGVRAIVNRLVIKFTEPVTV